MYENYAGVPDFHKTDFDILQSVLWRVDRADLTLDVTGLQRWLIHPLGYDVNANYARFKFGKLYANELIMKKFIFITNFSN